MRGLTVLPAYLILKCFASPIAQHLNAENQEASFTDAFDVRLDIALLSLNCLHDGYKTGFVRTYNGTTCDDRILPEAVSNIQLASAVGLHVEVYMNPLIDSDKTGAQQLEVMYDSLLDSNITVKSVWLTVADKVGSNWSWSYSRNVQYLNSFLQRANIYGLTVGIFTSLGDWSAITGNAKINNILLWYYVSDKDLNFEKSAPNFDDFVPFAGWTYPTVKQFDRTPECEISAYSDIYSTSSAAVADVTRRGKSDHVVGGLGLGSTAFAGNAEIRQ